jgi:hypothetical protein
MDILNPNTALGSAIVEAVEIHPAVSTAPNALRSMRRAAVTAAAEAMADARDADPDDVERAQIMAPQLVDDAALSLSLHHQRTMPIILDGDASARHDELAELVSDLPLVSVVGLDDGDTLARVEEAIARTMLVRAKTLSSAGVDERDVVRWILSTAMRAAAERGVRMSDLDDDDLVELVEDSLDDALASGEGGA